MRSATRMATLLSRVSWNTSNGPACTLVTLRAASLRRPSRRAPRDHPRLDPRLPSAYVVGLINIKYAVIPDGTVYIIEAARASRTVPFVAKAIGHPLAKYASLVMSVRRSRRLASR